MARNDGFPRWAVFWRAYFQTEAMLARLPVVLTVPTLAALIGSAWAASHPSEVVRHGLVVHQASFGTSLATALVGGVVGLLVLVLLVFLASLAWYRLLGDRVWAVHWVMSYENRPNGITLSSHGVSLECKADPPVSVSSLGHVEAVVRNPSGEFMPMPQHGMGSTPQRLWFAPVRGRPDDGTYEVRWYATRQTSHRQEVARQQKAWRG
jgi:hypothetical protein